MPDTTKVREHYSAMELTERIKSALATLGGPFRYEPQSIPQLTAEVEKAGFSARFVQYIASVAQDYQDGIFAGTNDVIETITGKPPLTLEEFVPRNRAKFTV
jgi:hypothetical protein